MHFMLLMTKLLKSMLEIKLSNDIDYEDIYDNINDYEYPYNHINREGVWDMNKALVIGILNAYAVINDGCLTIVTDYKVFNNCRVSDLDLNLVYVGDKDNELFRIELDDIIGIQFQDEATLVGMK